MHLLLVLFILTASWVHWSLGSNDTDSITHVFGLPYLVLLIDVGLVIIYLILVQQVEINATAKRIEAASASPEALWVMVMFGGYLLWDVVHDRFLKHKPWITLVASGTCVAISTVLWWLDRQFACDSALFVLFVDVALIALVFFFRGFKGLENKKLKRLESPWKVASGVSGAFVVVGLVGMTVEFIRVNGHA